MDYRVKEHLYVRKAAFELLKKIASSKIKTISDPPWPIDAVTVGK